MMLSEFDKLLVVFVILVAVIIGVNAVDVAVNEPFHLLQQIAVSSSNLTSVDSDGDGNIDFANNGVPSGAIIMWSGEISAIPTGWKLCDGINDTPDLSGRFIVGYDASDSNYDSIGETGGQDSVALTVGELPSHSHSASGSTDSDSHSHTAYIRGGTTNGDGGNDYTSYHVSGGYVGTSSDTHNHSVYISIKATGSNQAHENRPPYYTLAFIIKE